MKLKDYQTIIDLCDEIQEKTPYCVFFFYSGHVQWVDLNISVSKSDYNSTIYTLGTPNGSLKECEKRLKEILQDGLTSLSLVDKANENDIKKKYESQLDLGVAKRRAIANISREFNLTQKMVSEIVNK